MLGQERSWRERRRMGRSCPRIEGEDGAGSRWVRCLDEKQVRSIQSGHSSDEHTESESVIHTGSHDDELGNTSVEGLGSLVSTDKARTDQSSCLTD